MFIESGVDDDRSMAIAWQYNSGSEYRVLIKNALHENFGDIPYITRFFFPGGDFRYPNVGVIDQVECTKIVRSALIAFFDRHLLGKKTDVKNVLREYKDVEVKMK
jgi:hypothetical protein